MAYPTIKVRIGAAAMSNISYKTEWEIEIEADELEGMDRNQIYTHLIDQYGMQMLMDDIELFIPDIDEIADTVESLDNG